MQDIKWLPHRPDHHLTFAICVCITIRVDIIFAFRIGGMQQVHRIAYLGECLGALFRFFLTWGYMCDPYESPLVAEAFDRLKKEKSAPQRELEKKPVLGKGSAVGKKRYLGPLFLEQHLALDELVVRPWTPSLAIFDETVTGGRWRGCYLAVVKDEEELVGHVLFDLDHFVIAHKVELCCLSIGGRAKIRVCMRRRPERRGEGRDYGRTSSSSCRDSMPRGSARDSLNCSADS